MKTEKIQQPLGDIPSETTSSSLGIFKDSPHESDSANAKAAETVPFHRLTLKEVWKTPLPYMARTDRFIIRWLVYWLQKYVIGIEGLEHIQKVNDPFILGMNHNQKNEAIAVPALMFFNREGKKIHFFSDWNFQLIPIVRGIIRRAEVITLTRKSAKPKFLNVLKPYFELPEPAFDIAKKKLLAGGSVGVYPEGTVNRHPTRLLKGYSGMARLSIESGCPVVPVGISYPQLPKDRMIPDWEPMYIKIGAPMQPPIQQPEADLEAVRGWHTTIMQRIAELSGKQWNPDAKRAKQQLLKQE